ncbi:Fanconi anemia group A protein-like [Mobula birostris]|uniref:Fanconi anemia group A protein-like n=1 Tax=Mobula birostris TaxID=1983395 RepID=UPI003B2831AA
MDSTPSHCRTGVTQRKTLSQLLGSRLSRQRKRCPPEPLLQETVTQFMRHHQNLSDLLLEVSGSESKRLCNDGDDRNADSPATGSFIASVIQEQALLMDLPSGLLSARACVEKIQQIAWFADTPRKSVMLDSIQRSKLVCLLQTLQELLSTSMLSRLQFSEEIWKARETPMLEVVWHLQKENIVSLEELVTSNPDVTSVVCWLFDNLCLLCSATEDHPQHQNIQSQILSDIVTELVRNGYMESNNLESDSKPLQFKQICFEVLNRMLSWLLDNVCKEVEKDDPSVQKATLFWLNVFDVTLFHGIVSLDLLKQFFYYTLTQILTFNPVLEASDAIRMQGEWCFAKTKTILTTLYRKLFVLFSAEELVIHLRQVLETHEVNWQNVLSCASTLLICQPQTQKLLKELLASLLLNSFENYELESIITAFLLVRQAALEGPAVFISYSEWFKNSFGSANGYHGNSKKALIFLLKFLTDLVPFESAQYLKVHILHPPYVPSKYRALLLEYISLAKTRLADLQVSVEDIGLYEDLSTAHCPPKPQCQALQDVEKAILIFENTGRIPASVMEASIFRRPYYLTRFLPALLTSRVLPESLDSRMAFIDSLRKADKIPDNVYTSYIHACDREKQRLLEGVSASEEMEHPREPINVLSAALEELRRVATSPNRSEDVSAQIAVISGQLKTMIDDGDDYTAVDKPIHLNTVRDKLGPLELEVRDLLLKSFCQIFLTTSSFNPSQRQSEWAFLFVKMLCGHRRLLCAVLLRVLQLTTLQGSSLSDVHILGLAGFTIHIHILQICISVESPQSADTEDVPFVSYLNRFLVCSTGDNLTFCLRFCTVAVVYAICLSSSSSSSSSSLDVVTQFVPSGFVQKLLYIVPRLIPKSRREHRGVVEFTWNNLVGLNLNWTSAAFSVFKHRTFKELAQMKNFQLTFYDWLMSELEIQPHGDLLSNVDRQEYQHWACYQHYLPSPLTAGGCGGDLVTACRIIINALMDFNKRAKVQNFKEFACTELPSINRSGYENVICLLQEIVFDLERLWAKAPGKNLSPERGHFLLDVFRDRKAKVELLMLSQQLEHQAELHLFVRILLALPPVVLFRTCTDGPKTILECGEFFQFTNRELRNGYSKELALPFDITLHFFRGLLSASVNCEEPSSAVAGILDDSKAHCPLLMLSAMCWWVRLEPVLSTQWKRISDSSFPRELQRMVDSQCWANRLLLGKLENPPACPSWVLGAFLYFTLRRENGLKMLQTATREICAENEMFQISVLYLILMDLVSSLLQPKETSDITVTLKACTDVIMVLEEQNKSWLNIFSMTNQGHNPHQFLYSMMSDMEIKLLPVVFYSFIPTLGPKLLSSVIKHPDFLLVAITVYSAIIKLFLDGEVISASDQCDLQSDPLELITIGRQFLLRIIPRCSSQILSQRNKLQVACKFIDPELKASLDHQLQLCFGDGVYSEPILLE